MKEIADMTEPELRELSSGLARTIEKGLPPGPSARGTAMFALLYWDKLEGGVAQYVSSAQRAEMITFLRETADRLERRQDVTR